MRDRRRGSQSRSSNPASPTTSHTPLNSPPLGSRPHSRSQSYPHNIASLYNSDHFDDSDDFTISQPVSTDNSLDEMSFLTSISSLPKPKHESDSDSDDEVQNILIYDRSAAQSNASMDSQERVDVLNKTIDELRKKLSDTEKGLNRKVNDLEMELEEAQEKLEELKAELIAARKEEKELKSKEVCLSFYPCLVSFFWLTHHFPAETKPEPDFGSRGRDIQTPEGPRKYPRVIPEPPKAIPRTMCRIRTIPTEPPPPGH